MAFLPYPRRPLKSSHRIHRIHGSFWRGIFSHRFHRCSQIFRLRCCLLICVHPCLSVGDFLRQTVLCVPRVLWEHSFCLLCWCCRGSCTSVVVFSHGFHVFPQKLGCVVGGVGMAGCHTLLICAYLWEAFSARRFCVFRVFCGTLSLFALLVHLWVAHLRRFPFAVQSVSVRRPIRFRPPPNRIPSAVRSDTVRHPIGFRPPSDQIAFAIRSDSVRCTMP